MQTVLTIVIVAAAVAYVLWRTLRQSRHGGCGCGCHCGSCGQCSHCDRCSASHPTHTGQSPRQ